MLSRSNSFIVATLIALPIAGLFGGESSNAQIFTGKFISNRLSGKCIDVAGAPGRTNGAGLQLWDCELSGRNPSNNTTTDQRWTITSNGYMINLRSGKCIDVAGAPGRANGANLQLWDCEFSGKSSNNFATDQRWTLAN